MVVFAAGLVESLTNRFSLDDQQRGNIGGSIGVAVYPHDDAGVDKLLKNADKATYEVKNPEKTMSPLRLDYPISLFEINSKEPIPA